MNTVKYPAGKSSEMGTPGAPFTSEPQVFIDEEDAAPGAHEEDEAPGARMRQVSPHEPPASGTRTPHMSHHF